MTDRLDTILENLWIGAELHYHKIMGQGQTVDMNYPDKKKAEARAAITQLLQEERREARIEESKLWYSEWGYGTEESQIGSGTWEEYYEHRIQALTKEDSKQ